MFTGIIQEKGRIVNMSKTDISAMLKIAAGSCVSSLKTGSSIAVDGACLSVVGVGKNFFIVELISETLRCTIAKHYKKGMQVHLEPSLRIGSTLDGHIVTGHVDFTGVVKKVLNEGDSLLLTIAFPSDRAKFFAIKGSVAVNGVSLTISNLKKDAFEVALIPQTLSQTNLGFLQKGSMVNVEIDLVSRYLDQLLQDKARQTTYEFLQERGFL